MMMLTRDSRRQAMSSGPAAALRATVLAAVLASYACTVAVPAEEVSGCPAVVCPSGTDPVDANADGCPDECQCQPPCGADQPPVACTDSVSCNPGQEPLDLDGDGCADTCECSGVPCPVGQLSVDSDLDGCADSCTCSGVQCPPGLTPADFSDDGCIDSCLCTPPECAGAETAVDVDGDGCAEACECVDVMCPAGSEPQDADSDGCFEGCGCGALTCGPGESAQDDDGDGCFDTCACVDLQCDGDKVGADTSGDGCVDMCTCPALLCPADEAAADLDGDGCADACMCSTVACVTGKVATDTDGDGCGDACVCPASSCPVGQAAVDADGDGCADACQCTDLVCAGDEIAADLDGDGCADACQCVDVICPVGKEGADTDADGCSDACQCAPFACPSNEIATDSSGDGCADTCTCAEILCSSGKTASDSDGDGCSDTCQCDAFSCPSGKTASDSDGDGCQDTCQCDAFSCPSGKTASDSDGDGCSDTCQCPALVCAPGEYPVDTSGDGCTDSCECILLACLFGQIPQDTDGDGCNDACACAPMECPDGMIATGGQDGGCPNTCEPAAAKQGGGLSVVGQPSWVEATSRPGVWTDIPGLSSGVYANDGDDLAITVTAEMAAPGMVWVRAIVDEAVGQPSDVAFKFGGVALTGVHSFTFVQPDVPEGFHLVRIQWLTGGTEQATIWHRSLSVQAGAASSGPGRLATSVAPSGANIVHSNTSWQQIPGLSTTFQADGSGAARITVSGETFPVAGAFLLRTTLDGEPTAPLSVIFDDADGAQGDGTRSYTFTQQGVTPGQHEVRVEWAAEAGGQIQIGDRSLVVAFEADSSPERGIANATSLVPLMLPLVSTSWDTVPTLVTSFTTTAPSSNLEILVSGQGMSVNGRLFLRALVDGVPTQTEEADVSYHTPRLRALSFVFTQRDLTPGAHTVQIQWSTDAGAICYLSAPSLSVLYRARDGADFARPFFASSDDPILSPIEGEIPLVTICLDPHRPNDSGGLQELPSHDAMTAMLFGTDGGTNAQSWLDENSGGRLSYANHGVMGCPGHPHGLYFEAPAEHQGTWYWDKPEDDGDPTTGRHTIQWQDAIKAASAHFDFAKYDKDKDGHITGDELAVIVALPQDQPYGTFRTVEVAIGGAVSPMSFDIADMYVSSLPSQRLATVGGFSHELAHAIYGAGDMYTNGNPARPGMYSAMDNNWSATHLDPFHKLKSGWLPPAVIELSAWAGGEVWLDHVEAGLDTVILYDPARGDDEYFVVENRWGGTPDAPNYDAPLPEDGIVVWHIIEDSAAALAYPPPGVSDTVWGALSISDWARTSVRRFGPLAGPLKLVWGDGSSAGFTLSPEGNAGAFMAFSLQP